MGVFDQVCFSIGRSVDNSEEDKPRKAARGSRQASAIASSSSGDVESEEEARSSDASDEFFTNKKMKAKKRKATSSGAHNGKKKLRRAGTNDTEDTSDYASFAGKNPSRSSALRRSVNYDEAEAYDSALSDNIQDENGADEEEVDDDDDDDDDDDGSARPKQRKQKKAKKSWKDYELQGDSVEGIFDHKRDPEMGMYMSDFLSKRSFVESMELSFSGRRGGRSCHEYALLDKVARLQSLA